MPKYQNRLDFINKFKKSDSNNEYDLITDFKNSREKIKIRHRICGTVYQIAPYHFLNGQRCVKCGKFSDRKINHQEFIEKYADLYSGYQILSEYKGSSEKMTLRHLGCNNIVNISPSHFKKGRRCRFCSVGNSKMEAKVESYLFVNSIKYEREYTFTDCVSDKNRKLPFDFCVFVNDSDYILIECDGSQHYDKRKKWYSEKNLVNDSIKNEYALNKAIKLIRIREDQISGIYPILDVYFKNSKYPEYKDIDKFYSRKINFEKASKIKKMYLSGKSSKEIASEFDVSRPTITNILNYKNFSESDLDIKEKIMKKIKSKKKSLESYKLYKDIDKINYMLNEGKSLREIGRFLNCSNQNIKRIINLLK